MSTMAEKNGMKLYGKGSVKFYALGNMKFMRLQHEKASAWYHATHDGFSATSDRVGIFLEDCANSLATSEASTSSPTPKPQG